MGWYFWALWAYGVAALHLLALWRARRAARSAPATGTAPLPRHVLIRPVAGQEPALYDTLMSVRAAIPVPAQVLHLVSRGDPAEKTAQRASAALRQLGIEASTHLTSPCCPGDNPKVAQLLQAPCEAPYLIYADCSVDLCQLRLGELLAPLQQDAQLGAVWVPTYEEAGNTLAQRANHAVRTASLHSSLLLGQLDRQLLAGAVMAVRLTALQQVGGWAALRTRLGEDMALGQCLRRCGWRSRMLPYTLRIVRQDTDRWRGVLARYGRWLWVIRSQRPLLLLSYPLLFCASVPLAALPYLVSSAPAWTQLGGLALLAARLVTAGCSRRLHCHAVPAAPWSPGGVTSVRRWVAGPAALAAAAVDSLLADLLLAAALCRCLGSRRIAWGTQRLRVNRDGTLKSSAAGRSGS